MSISRNNHFTYHWNQHKGKLITKDTDTLKELVKLEKYQIKQADFSCANIFQ